MPIQLYITPFALESPFHLVVFSKDPLSSGYYYSSSDSVQYRLNNLVEELQKVPVPETVLDNATSNFQSAPKAQRWMLFRIERTTLVSMLSATALLETMAQTANGYDLGGQYLVLPTSLAFTPGLLAGIKTLLPRMIPYVSIHDARKIIPNPCKQCQQYGSKACYPTDHAAKDKFHANGLSLPWTEGGYRTKVPKGVQDVKSQCHLGIWIPGISLPWDLVVSVQSSMGTKITELFTSVLREWKSENVGKSLPVATLGYYPSAQNWMLVDCGTGMLIHSILVRDIKLPPEGTKTYIVIPIQYGTLAKSMLEALRKDGATGWEEFWSALVGTTSENSDTESSIGSPFESAAPSVSGYD